MAGQLLFRHLPLVAGAIALDVGCGTGFPAIELAERLGPNASVTGIDSWARALERARRKAAIRRVGNVRFVEGDAVALPFADASFDLIVSNLGLNNFARPEAALAECRRVARPGARLALTTNLQGHMAEFYAIFRGLLDASEAEALDRHIAHRATVARVEALFGSAGFAPLRHEAETVVMRYADGTALLRHSFIRLGFLPAWRNVVPPARRDGVFAELELALDRHAAEKGGLTLTVPMAYLDARAR